MNNIPIDVLEEIILNKVKLFTKEAYFHQFRSILLELYNNKFAFKKKTSLCLSLMSKIKERKNASLWHIISLIIFPPKSQLKEESMYETEYNLHPLCFQYLKNLCYVKKKKLTNLSVIEDVSLERVVSTYINLCEKRIREKKERRKGTLKLKGNYLQMNNKRKASLLMPRQNSVISRPQLKLNIKKLINKNGPSIQPLDYANSFTRLFIGETDEQSVRERYLFNMIVKKQKQLHLLNSYNELSVVYLKKMYKKLFKNEGQKGVMDNDMITIIKQFENDHKKIDNFQRVSEKPHYMHDENQNMLALELFKQKEQLNQQNRNRNIKGKRNKIKYNTNSFIRSVEVSKDNQAINLKKFYSRKKTNTVRNNSVNYEKKKIGDAFMFNRRIMNSNGNYKMINARRYNFLSSKYHKKNFSAVFGTNRLKDSCSDNNKKKYLIVNYMNKRDFFFF